MSSLPNSAGDQLLSQPIERRRVPMGGVTFFLAFVVMSPVLSTFGIKGIAVLFGVLLLFLINGRLQVGGFQKWVYVFIGIYLSCAIASGVYWGTHVPLMFAVLYVVTVLMVANLRRDELDVLVGYATPFIGLLIVLGWIGLAYYLAGGPPLAAIQNPDTRPNLLYLTTFSNATGDGYLRPGGIYDEPGAFSFFICTLCTVRELLQKNRNVTALLLIGGLVTASIAHLIFMLFHFSQYLLSANKKGNATVLLISAVVLGGVLLSGRAQTIVQELVIERAMKYQSGEMSNPRELQMLNVYRESNWPKVMLGFGADCVNRTQACTDALGGDFGENPLTPVVFGGLLLGWPYYLFILAMMLYGISSRDRLPLVGFGLILMQRPYVLEFPYSATVFIVVAALAVRLHDDRKRHVGRTADSSVGSQHIHA
jgi:hypothetical protein